MTMSSKNMNWNQFLTEFVLRASTNEFIENYTLDQVIELARRSWDAIQAAEIPDSEKAKQEFLPSFVLTDAIAPIPLNSGELKSLAEKAVEISEGIAKYIAIDKHGTVYAYKQKPIIKSDVSTCWDISDLRHPCWLVDHVAEPADFRNELYKISKLLNNENQ